jgi:hypothetical protein
MNVFAFPPLADATFELPPEAKTALRVSALEEE